MLQRDILRSGKTRSIDWNGDSLSDDVYLRRDWSFGAALCLSYERRHGAYAIAIEKDKFKKVFGFFQ